MGWDHVRNEPISEENTQEVLGGLSAAAQAAELSGDSMYAEACHREMNRELDELDGLKGR
ncbi:hypothetical protein [Streptomyces luteocolor]|uniref:hypothetical protein n=1 Tax=Streptomyces luteocolor TaxID=285500 RepID=UPI000852F52A|nr:hypothetical protein [Streptomyces luteocolor]